MAFDYGRVQKIREALGYSRTEFAGIIGCAMNTIKNIEEGKTSPGTDIIDSIIKNFNPKRDIFFV